MNKLYCHIKVDLVILPWYLSIFWVVQSWIDERQKTSRLPFQWHVTILFCWRYFESPFSSFFFSKDSGSQALPFLSIPHVNLTVAEGHQLIDSWYSSYQKKHDVLYQGISAASQIPHDAKACTQQPYHSSWYKSESSDSNLTDSHNAQILISNFFCFLACAEWRKNETLYISYAHQYRIHVLEHTSDWKILMTW